MTPSTPTCWSGCGRRSWRPGCSCTSGSSLPSPAAERDQYYEEWKLVAYGCGVPRGGCPASWADFESYVERVIAEDLRVTRAARSVAHATMEPPLPWPLNRLSAGPQQLVTIGIFPPPLRDGFGFAWDAARERRGCGGS